MAGTVSRQRQDPESSTQLSAEPPSHPNVHGDTPDNDTERRYGRDESPA